MGQCVQCNDFFPPSFMVDLKEEKNPPQKCAFCYLDKKKVTMVNEEEGTEEIISKEEAKKRYKILLKRLYQSKNIQKVLESAKGIPLIKDA